MEQFVDEQATSTSGGSSNFLTITFGTAFAAGDTMFVATRYEDETHTATVTDGASNAYTPDAPYIDTTLHLRLQWFQVDYLAIPGTNTITLRTFDQFGAPVGVASKGIWGVRFRGLNQATATQFAAWIKQIAPGTAANALIANPLTPAKQPYLALALSMSATGSSGALPITGTPGYTNRAASWSFAGGTGNCARMEEKRITNTNPFSAVFSAGVGSDTYITGMLIRQEAPVVNPYKVNPMGLAYQSVTGVPNYAQKSGMLITGRNNRYDPAFASARAAGAEILAYVDPIESPSLGHTLGGLDDIFYLVVGGVPGAAPWPFTANGTFGTTLGANRVNFANTFMTDITAGSAWSNNVVSYVTALMIENKVDGVFLDVNGGRLFSSLAAWGLLGSTGDWPQNEMNAWTAGCVDLVRRLDVLRRLINPNFIIVNNNTWDTGDSLNNGFLGEPYVDGVDLEHHPSTSSYQQAYAGKTTFSNLGHRRFLVIAQSTADAIAWAQIPGVTDVSDQASYNSPDNPPISFQPVSDRVAPVTKNLGAIVAGSGLILPFST